MPILITIRGEVQTKGNVCRVTRRNGDQLGHFGPNSMSIWQDNPYDPIPYRQQFKPEGAILDDWKQFKLRMFNLNGRIIRDEQMPGFLRDEAHFLNVE